MKEPYLEVTFRHGRPLAAYLYLYLPRASDDKSVRTSKAGSGMVVDFNQSGEPIGIELTVPGEITLEALDRALHDLGVPSLTAADLEPLRAA